MASERPAVPAVRRWGAGFQARRQVAMIEHMPMPVPDFATPQHKSYWESEMNLVHEKAAELSREEKEAVVRLRLQTRLSSLQNEVRLIESLLTVKR